MSSGSEVARPRRVALSASSTTAIDRSFSDTWRPTYCVCWGMTGLKLALRGRPDTRPTITPCPGLRVWRTVWFRTIFHNADQAGHLGARVVAAPRRELQH